MSRRSNSKSKAKLTFHKLNWLEWIAIGFSLWFVLHPSPYKVLFVILMAIPILGLVLNGLNGRPSIASLVRVKKNGEGEKEYDVADFIDISALAILIRIMKDYEFESYYSVIIPGTIAFVSVCLIVFATHRLIENSTPARTWIYLTLFFNIFIYSFSGTYGINCVFDQSEANVYNARVIDKKISKSRRSTSYYVKVTPWGHHLDSEKIEVGKSQFDDLEVGEHISIDVHEGLFSIPWYYIE